jgi:hypothetical protein
MVAAMLAYAFVRYGLGIEFPTSMYAIVALTTVAWVAATLLTRPTDRAVLEAFYRRVHPGGAGWAEIARSMPDVESDSGFGGLFVDWAAGVVLVYCFLFAVGRLLYGEYAQGLAFAAVGIAAGAVIWRDLSRRMPRGDAPGRA